MSIAPGTRLGSFEITALIGQGGMGEVWAARDTTLNRQVAIKTLSAKLAHDPDRVDRLAREATLQASLNHPNIAAIHGFERHNDTPFLVLELVEGHTLAHRLESPMSVEEALRLALQIAEALEAAHDKGVIHRDLKPANIKVTPEGRIKVLDFGIAKVLEPAADDVTAIATHAGAILGTPAYMSPEQARGEVADRKSDIWSFGVVLYEMLSGVSPFRKRTSAETLAGVLATQPDFSLLPVTTPVNVRRILRRCLEKDPRQRLQHMGDVRIEIEEAMEGPSAGAPLDPAKAVGSTRRLRFVAAAVGLALIGGPIGWFVVNRPTTESAPGVVRLEIASLPPPSGPPSGVRHVAISDDGSRVAYSSASGLWIRGMDRSDAVAIQGSSSNPFFSPNGNWVGFFFLPGAAPVGGLMKVPARGGTPVLIAPVSARPTGGAWRADGTIVFATTEGLFQVPENGGEPRLLVKPDPQRRERTYAWPEFLPDGRSLLFTIVPQDSADRSTIALLNLSTLEVKVLVNGGSAAHVAPTGHLIYATGQALRAIRFDPDAKLTRGDPVAIQGVAVATTTDNGAAEFAISRSGTLVFMPPIPPREPGRLVWVDHQGREEPLPFSPGRYGYPRISPDGTRVALDINDNGRDIWIANLQRGSLTRLTDGPTEDLIPLWSRDGQRVFFGSDRSGNFDIYSQAADGASPARKEYAAPGVQMPISLTPDGTRMLIQEDFKGLSLFTLASDHAEPFMPSEFNHWQAAVSPDGKSIAYESNESGNKMEIFLRPFPDVGRQREKVSINGGRYPLWAPKGGELYYVDPDGNMMAVPVTLSPGLSLGRVTKLFAAEKPSDGISSRPYDISPIDGRFLLARPVTERADRRVNLSVILNWFTELREHVPRDK